MALFSLKHKFLEHNASLYALHFNKYSNLLFTGGGDKVLASWDLNTMENTPFSIKTKSAILTVDSVYNRYLFVGLFNGDFHIIDLEQKKEIKYFPYHKGGIFSFKLNTSLDIFALGSADGTVSFWTPKDWTLIKSIKIGEEKIRAIQCIENTFIIGTREGNIYKVNDKLELEHKVKDMAEGVNTLLYLPSKNAVLAGCKNAHIEAFKTDSFERLLNVAAHNWPIYKLTLLNDNLIASCSRDKTIKVWDAETMEIKERISFPTHKGHTNSINNLIWVEEYKSMISVGDDKAICVWQKN